MQPENQPSSARIVLSLGFAGLLAGLVLVGGYLGTFERIQKNQAERLQRAIFTVLPGANHADPYRLLEGTLEKVESDGAPITGDNVVYLGLDEKGETLGYAVPAKGPGFMDTISLLYGFDPSSRAIVGMAVLEHRETPGLGDKITKDPLFQANFEKLLVEPSIVPVKRGDKTQANEVDCITGATISSKSVVKILNKSTARWLEHLAPQSAVRGGGH